jgi:glycosyltransferase involved in cell wall biosynthesis
MQIEAHIIAWNESDIIGLTINHYKDFCSRIVIHDNHSTDGTDRIAKELGCDVNAFGKFGELSDKEYLKIKNNAWKGSDADWVIMCDADEIIYHNRIKEELAIASLKNETIFKTQGWQVVSNEMPQNSLLEITNGYLDPNYSKAVIFNPKALTNINYHYGCHTAQPQGNVKYADTVLSLLHYRNIGGVQRLIDRHKAYRKRLSPLNKELGLGCHYMYDDERRKREWEEQLQKSGSLSQAGF